MAKTGTGHLLWGLLWCGLSKVHLLQKTPSGYDNHPDAHSTPDHRKGKENITNWALWQENVILTVAGPSLSRAASCEMCNVILPYLLKIRRSSTNFSHTHLPWLLHSGYKLEERFYYPPGDVKEPGKRCCLDSFRPLNV